ncbi:hypothetical protein MWU58_09495 [Flavobacteriaceae bacterium S0825]|uniref:DUF6624 domain-containing protein n=1 Tax=Gaetbulibacter sp. S0825 TaxID=2720084 RepID=UPI0014304F90|nr:DUF6624 domain-containing protein [Gaetbulibacter sp. S0825]MCK0109527.1 hypothetical protein [Flavobacteriaceae bacterium S0825]NIX65161.1 hypothetical protein [Gaetbulibacter sp. S0825]
MRITLLLVLFFAVSCADQKKTIEKAPSQTNEQLISMLDSIWTTEQQPITLRDSMIELYGADSKEAEKYQLIYEKNHAINEEKITNLLDSKGWPEKSVIGEQGNWTICNVIQHAENDVRIKYLPMMKEAVLAKQLQPRFLVRAQDRIATEQGQLQIYGGQMKYYPETKSFNVWPVFEPENIDKRRAEIGLEPIAEFLKARFDFDWNLEEQIQRSKEFEAQQKKSSN